MFTQVKSITLDGIDGQVVSVEVDVQAGLPQFNIVGLPASSIREAKDRVRSAITNSGFEFPMQRITVNLAPADSKKDGSSIDLAIAVGILSATGQVPPPQPDLAIIGELSLDGSTRSIVGTLPLTIAAFESGIKCVAASLDALEHLALPTNHFELTLYGIRTLRELASFLKHELSLEPYAVSRIEECRTQTIENNLSEVLDQPLAKRALEIAAAGSHNLLLIGPPGCGKSMLASRMEGILPSLTTQEALEVNKIYSVAHLHASTKAIFVNHRPFRSPHHSISIAGLVGGGIPPKPGEITLAHNGVLFLDEFAEFPRHMLDQLRQPLEAGYITISRSHHSYTLPSRFQLVAAMNPCPCGYYHSTLPCRCTPYQITRYQTRLSGPILDRFQLYVWVQQPNVTNMVDRIGNESLAKSESSQVVRERVEAAYDKQRQRNLDGLPNSSTSKHSVELWEIEPQALELWQQTSIIRKLSARSHDQLIRVARTIADLSAHKTIEVVDIAESLQYTDRSLLPLV